MKTTLAVLLTLASMGSALAQTTQAPPPPQGPTELQCREGYKAGMQWTQGLSDRGAWPKRRVPEVWAPFDSE